MKLKRFTDYMLEHRLRAVLLTFGFTFIPVVGTLGILYAALVTLRKGVVEGAIMTVAATLPHIFLFMFAAHEGHALPLALWMVMSLAVAINVLTWVFAALLYRQMTWSGIIQVAALVGVLGVSIVHLVYPNIASWWSEQLTTYFTQVASSVSGVLKNSVATPSDDQLIFIKNIKDEFSGVVVATALLWAVIQLAMARWWQAVLYAPGMLRRELHNIRLSPLAGVLFGLGVLLSTQSLNSVVSDIMPILYLLFVGAGLSVLHYFIGLMVSPTRWFWIALLYVMLLFSLPLSKIVVAMVALLDIWLDVRRKLRKV